jgi:hypothetical protein
MVFFMNLRKFLSVILAIVTFIGVGVVITTFVHTIWPDYWFSDHPLERMLTLLACALSASLVYGMVKGDDEEKMDRKLKN